MNKSRQTSATSKQSAGIVLVRSNGGVPEILLVHPGGPFWKNRDDGSWSIPKGEFQPGDDALHTALREFEEEIGLRPPNDPPHPLGSVTQAGGKVVHAWRIFGDLDLGDTVSNTFELEWPPKSGRTQTFPEVDRVAYFPLEIAVIKILSGQLPLLYRALE